MSFFGAGEHMPALRFGMPHSEDVRHPGAPGSAATKTSGAEPGRYKTAGTETGRYGSWLMAES
jgi:hypothetical protein